MGLGEKAGKFVGDLFNADDNNDAIAASRDRQLRMAGGMPYEPQYVSNLTTPYQKSQSPVARSYLESMLTGTNPDLVSRGAPNAAAQKQQMSQQQDQLYGTMADRQALATRMAATNPYQVKPITRQVGGPEDQEMLHSARYGKMADAGIDRAGMASLEAPGHFDLSDDAAVDWAGGKNGTSWKYVKQLQDAGDTWGAQAAIQMMSSDPNFTAADFNKMARQNGKKSRLT